MIRPMLGSFRKLLSRLADSGYWLSEPGSPERQWMFECLECRDVPAMLAAPTLQFDVPLDVEQKGVSVLIFGGGTGNYTHLVEGSNGQFSYEATPSSGTINSYLIQLDKKLYNEDLHVYEIKLPDQYVSSYEIVMYVGDVPTTSYLGGNFAVPTYTTSPKQIYALGEFSFDDNGFNFDTSIVDGMSMPYYTTTSGTLASGTSPNGIVESLDRVELFSLAKEFFAGTDFNNLITDQQIVSPKDYLSEHTSDPLNGYFDTALADFFAKYHGTDFSIEDSGNGITYSGRTILEGETVDTVTAVTGTSVLTYVFAGGNQATDYYRGMRVEVNGEFGWVSNSSYAAGQTTLTLTNSDENSDDAANTGNLTSVSSGDSLTLVSPYTMLKLVDVAAGSSSYTYNIYDPLGSRPTWLGTETSGQMVFACDGAFNSSAIDPMYELDPSHADAVAALQNRIVSAFNRGIAVSADPSDWEGGNHAQFYPDGQPSNLYAKFFHQGTISIGTFAYAFAYDDDAGQSTDITVKQTTAYNLTIHFNQFTSHHVTPTPGPVPSEVGENWIERLYLSILHRKADASGLAQWTRLFASGQSRQSIVDGIWNSVEHRTNQVEHYYRYYLGRTADAAGLQHWVNQFLNGADEYTIIAGFVGSPEYFQINAGSDAEFLASLYEKLLRRDEDAVGQAFWSQYLAKGGSRADVAKGFLESQEYDGDAITLSYDKILERAPDPTGEAFFSRWIQSDSRTKGSLEVELYISDEFVFSNDI